MMMRTSLATMALCLAAGLADAETVTIQITADVAAVDDQGNVLGGQVYVGQTISGSYTYDLDTPDSNSLPTVGDYWHSTPPFGIEVKAGDLTFRTDPTNVDFLVEIVNDHGNPPRDNYLLRSYNNEYVCENVVVEHISWQLDDDTATALDSTALPIGPPVLADWQSIFGLTMVGYDEDDPYDTGYLIRAHVTEATLLSECICVTLAAQVAHVEDPGNLLLGQVTVGDTLTGSYTYDPAATDSNSLPTVGDYWHSMQQFGIELKAGDFTFRTDPADVDFLVEIVNDHGNPPRDNYLLRSYNNMYLHDSVTVDHISWQLDDDTATALDSIELPTYPPVLGDWQSLFGVSVNGRDDNNPPYGDEYFIRAHVFEVGFCSSLVGDINCDGAIDFDDIDPFVLALSGQAAYEAQWPNCEWLHADINGDGDVTFDDIDAFVALLSAQ